MPSSATREKTVIAPLVIGLIVVIGLIAAVVYLRRPAATPKESAASSEAIAYLPHLGLSDVSMEANENFMKQRVIEIKGKITDKGQRSLRSVDVYCLFYGVDGREIHRERLPIVNAKTAPLHPGETRSFRLPFDAVPEGWNQALPKMVIARIDFAQ
jgi:hypothetical protein